MGKHIIGWDERIKTQNVEFQQRPRNYKRKQNKNSTTKNYNK